jgi:Histidine kinase-, DNA gyrase B-, and HSP90-like ATPase
MTSEVERTRLWASGLSVRDGDPDYQARQTLRQGWSAFRSNAAVLASEIHTALPDFTVHDITHLDALWEIADLIAGPDVTLNPAEAFVFGGAILLHDLGMALAAYPEGVEALKREPEWADEVTQRYMTEFNRPPTPHEIINPTVEIEKAATATLLRVFHARRAADLPDTVWHPRDGRGECYLIPNPDVRVHFGELIGNVAHSHWWTIDEVEREFERPFGAPPWCPAAWTVDGLKIACLLRLADAAHIDAGRAPRFLWALRQTSTFADRHWLFQSKINKPHLNDTALVYTSNKSFQLEEAAAWWLCFDTIQMIDRELRSVDTLLIEKKKCRFAAQQVAGAASPQRLSCHIQTKQWLPVDATLHVGDVAGVVEKLGGTALYGDDTTVPIRELIQNAADAVRARRIEDQLDERWGEILVRSGRENGTEWIEVYDNGLGMNSDVITGYLLNFGSSYWGSSLMREQHPGLLSSGLETAGKYGIGFFSVFMLGQRVRVTTRPYRDGRDATIVLEFGTGLASRPVLRPAKASEQLREGGTAVRVWIPGRSGRLRRGGHSLKTLSEVCVALAPVLDVDLIVEKNGDHTKVISAGDWLEISPHEFQNRLVVISQKYRSYNDGRLSKRFTSVFRDNLEIVHGEDGKVLGRACIFASEQRRYLHEAAMGFVTVGGLTSTELTGIAGILTGSPIRASRDAAIPHLAGTSLAGWATGQATLLTPRLDGSIQLDCASVICALGGSTEQLKVARSRDGLLNVDEIASWADNKAEVYVLQDAGYFNLSKKTNNLELSDNVLVTDTGIPGILQTEGSWWIDWPKTRSERFHSRTLVGAVVRGLAAGWGCDPEDVWRASLFSTDRKKVNRPIGVDSDRGKAVMHDVDILRRPTYNSASRKRRMR